MRSVIGPRSRSPCGMAAMSLRAITTCSIATRLNRGAMPESLRTKLARGGFNLFPAYRGTGARITYIADDYREVRIDLPLSWRTRNYVGTIFGGSMYAAVDPVYMI